ncbi:DNA topoisomerase 2 [Elasticomyces elasticus]|nr:DNA topoisomerase 2 [Elasticomyces elasticus]
MDSLAESDFDGGGASSDYEVPVKAKPKALAKAALAGKPKAVAKAAPKKAQSTLKVTKTAPKKRTKPDSDDENTEVHDVNSIHDDSLLSNTPPSAKRQKKALPPKKSSGKPLQEVDNESFGMDGIVEAKDKAKKGGATEKYQKLTQLEHILKRPDTYIGSVERTEQKMWVFNSETEAMENREVSYVPGLYKIFDEILVNAADNRQRDKNMNEMKVWVDREKGEISVRNNGRGIPIEIHDKEGIYIPEMIFGHLLTSSNYDDEEQKVTGGRNGYGAKLCNVFSTKFILETADSKQGKKYQQTWTRNMSQMEKAKITAHKGDDYTKITFYPDFAKFGMSEMDDDFEALVKRRVYDLAGTCSGVKVYLNDSRIKITKFKQYMEMYTKSIRAESLLKDSPDGADAAGAADNVILTDCPNERWEIGFAVSDGSFQQVSFVNSIATTSGGTHVNYVADQITTKLLEIVTKKNKGGVKLKNAQIKNHIFLFVNCLIVNPAFTSQTKEQLTTKATQFGSKCVVSDKFLKDIAKTEAVNNILHFAQQKADQVLKKSDGNRRQRMNNSKLTDANKAGTKDGWKCTLILTEGDSASLLALAGRAVVNPDLFGVFPLRGKLLNVRDASIDQISKNQEIQNIKKFMGLQHKKNYEDTKTLRYGHLMIMTDQDHDGSHIKGLLINFLEVQYPSLLRLPGFLMEFITPIVKVWRGDPKAPRAKKDFFTMPEYEAWREEPGHQKGWEHKYYKGLGTSDTQDAEIYFADLDRHLKTFHTLQAHEPELIDLAFSKKKADARKIWLRDFVPGTYLDMSSTEAIKYEDFINKELILFSMADNMRSIPSVIDGFKPGQRKVLYTCFRRNLKKDIKVVELAGSVNGLTAYQYGDTSLQDTIVGMAHNFVGSNNINCLEPSGNFGSRLQGGKDAASARYIYTRLSPFARRIFHAADEALLTYNTDDGKTIEPEVYVPVVPMILINGADGIGTGWSSTIPNYSPDDIVENIKRRMAGTSKEDMQPMTPWFRSFTGVVADIGQDRFKFSGTIRQSGDNEVVITELPVRVWTQEFKDRLEEIIKAEKVPSFIKDYTEYNTPTRVHFIIKMEEKHMQAALEKGLEETFKVAKTMATTNLVAFDAQGRIHKYASVLDIMEEFYHVRLKFYEKRKQYLLSEMQRELDKLSNQSRFIKMIIDGKLVVSKKKKKDLVTELKRLNFKPFPKVIDAKKQGEFEAVVEEDNDNDDDAEVEAGASDYDYLLGMAIWSLTMDRVEKLLRQIGDKEVEIDTLIKLSPKDLWTKDLDDFLAEWKFQLDDEAKRVKKAASRGRRASTKLGIGAKGGKKRKSDDSDAEDDSDFEGAAAAKKKTAAKPAAKAVVKAEKSAKPKGGLLAYLTSKSPDASKPASTYRLINGVEQKPVAKPPAEAAGISLDDSLEEIVKPAVVAKAATKPPPPKVTRTLPSPPDDEDITLGDSVEEIVKPPVVTKAAAKYASSTSTKAPAHAPKRAAKRVLSDDSDNDVFSEASEGVQPKPTTELSRRGRTAAAKPVKYHISDDSDSDNGDDMLGDVSAMVKGIGPDTAANGNRALFTASASASRPGSSHGIKITKRPALDMSSDVDETNYMGLIPQGSPQKPAARTARDVVLSDEEADSLDMITAPAPKAANGRRTIGKVLKPNEVKINGTAVQKPKKAPAVKEKAAPASKPQGLSPAAKAYAAKIAKAQAKPGATKPATKSAPKKKVVESDSDDEVEALANDLLSDEESPAPAPRAAAATARPARRAAAAKSKYVVDDMEDSEEDASEAAYDDEDSE